MGLSLSQLEGLYDGYNANCTVQNKIAWINFLLFQMQDELGDILSSFSQNSGWFLFSLIRIIFLIFVLYFLVEKQTKFDSHCSVLVRLTSDGQTLMASHDTWSTFNTMLRIYKYYTFPFNAAKTRLFTFWIFLIVFYTDTMQCDYYWIFGVPRYIGER